MRHVKSPFQARSEALGMTVPTDVYHKEILLSGRRQLHAEIKEHDKLST
jgi:hypothetical protein